MNPSRILLVTLAVTAPLRAAAVMFWEELPYFSAQDSPFYEGIAAGTIYLEDFEDHELNTPHVVSWDWPRSVQIGRPHRPGNLVSTFSVDADDGLHGDFRGLDGDTWTTTSAAVGGRLGWFDLRFEPDILGRYPTFVGFVVTEASDPFSVVQLQVDTLSWTENWPESYDSLTWAPRLDTFPGDTRKHRFFGVQVDDGITRLLISNVAQIDHLQYGYAIPEPRTAALLLLAGLLALRERGRPRPLPSSAANRTHCGRDVRAPGTGRTAGVARPGLPLVRHLREREDFVEREGHFPRALPGAGSGALTGCLWRGRNSGVNAEEIEQVLAPFWRTDDGRTASQRAEIYGIDLSLITENLRLTPEERIDQHQAALELVSTLQEQREK